MASTKKLQDLVNEVRAYPDLVPVLGTSGFTQQPALSIANDTMQAILAQNSDWKFNRKNAAPFLTVVYQQDYATSITDMGWLESCDRVDINNTATPKPRWPMEAGRDFGRTSIQQLPMFISQIPNSIATWGTWVANTAYPTGLGLAATPLSPIQQFIDVNGNYLVVQTNGTSGSTQPSLPPNASAGSTVTDGSVTWVVVDPNGIAFRLSPIPPQSGIVNQINPVYQKKPPILTSLQNTLAPIPDEYVYLFRQGFIAFCYRHSDASKFKEQFALWQETLMTALRAGDRERDETSLQPLSSVMGGADWGTVLPIGPGYPYAPYTQ